MTVFVDTSGLLALMDSDDRFHQAATAVWRQWVEEQPQLITSNYVILETVALLQGRIGIEAIRSLHESLLPVITIEWISPQTHRRAVTALLTAHRRHLSLVDCTSFQLMRDLELNNVFGFDPHFSQQGFTLLP